jgi:hypothetical protein
MFAEQLDFAHGVDHVGFKVQDLKLVDRDPGSALQVDAIKRVAQTVAVHMIGRVGTLAEVNKQSRLPPPLPSPFAVEVKVSLHVGMKNGRQNGEAGAGNPVGRSGLRNFIRPISSIKTFPGSRESAAT